MTISPSFETGRVYITISIREAVRDDPPFADFIVKCLRRHQSCDWGDVCEEDRQLNNESLSTDDRIFSVYRLPSPKFDEDKIWIITESDRSATTILFPFEY